ncbi:MAG: methyltransferase domain-containing protein [Puniceicoccaceae bacterium]|nr:MAG: methyltransferase domain-containing protein [Puniceicoccaceae bacterium]
MRLTEIVHATLAAHLQAGDFAIDATAGNGHDTCFLAEQVGASGRVLAIDIQADAIAATRARLVAAGLEARVELVCADHAQYLQSRMDAPVAAILFNLGYLPGGDHALTTQARSTEAALGHALQRLRPGGYLCVTAYPGHPAGIAEAERVQAWMQARIQAGHSVECHQPVAKKNPPILWVLRI